MRLFIILCLLLFVVPVLAIDDPLDNVPETPLVEVVVLGEIYLEGDWQGFHSYQDEYFVRYAWSNIDLDAVASIEQLAFENDDDMAEYFGRDIEDYFDITFENYAPFDLVEDCESDAVQLYEFEGVNDNEDYLIHLYLWEKDDETMWSLSLYFPTDFEDEMLETAEAFFPDFLSCDKR